MFSPRKITAGVNARVAGANDPNGSCMACNIGGANHAADCGARADKVSFLGIDRVPAPTPFGIFSASGTNSDFPSQTNNALSTGGAPAVMAWAMTFTPLCPSRIKQIFIDPQIAPELEVTALYLGYFGYQNKQNLLAGRNGTTGAQNDAPGLLFASLDVTVPLFQLIDAVGSQQAPFILVGRTYGTVAALTLRGALITEAV